tara:strand:+ start:504 stop:824 length:321 start_codon:yes stop_codon:yes gene_type:complete
MSIKLTNKQKKILEEYELLNKEDYDKLTDNQMLQFYNIKTKKMYSGKFKKFHCDEFIIVNNHFKEERIYTICNFIIYYKPRKIKKDNERLFMEQLLNNDIIITKLR